MRIWKMVFGEEQRIWSGNRNGYRNGGRDFEYDSNSGDNYWGDGGNLKGNFRNDRRVGGQGTLIVHPPSLMV